MSSEPIQIPQKEQWGTKLGVILAVAGSAVGLGNFLRFPGTAVNNGGGAFMIPYIISFILLGIPIAWCEWTMGRLGGRYGQNSGPGIMYALSRNVLGKFTGALTLVIPVTVYMYYVLLEALCLRYSYEFFSAGFRQRFADALAGTSQEAGSGAVVEAATEFAIETFGIAADGTMYGTAMLWLVLGCFLVNFVIIYRGVTKGIEKFCTVAMPMLIICALIILVRVLTLDTVVDGRTINSGLGFMWNPDWNKLREPEVWLRAAGQIFFSLSVGFGLILCYASYLRRNDDVVLSSLSASSTNEFCEVVLGGLIIVPTAFLFLGPGNTPEGAFSLGFFTVPAIMHYMPGGSFFGGMWFGLLFLAAVTSSISMLQPAIAFLEDGFGMRRRASVVVLGLITMVGAALVMFYSAGVTALDFTDFWCEFMMILAALGQVIIFGWIIGAKRGLAEANRGAEFKIPGFVAIVIRYVTPTFLIVILGLWCFYNGPDRLRAMSPSIQGQRAARAAYQTAIQAQPKYTDLSDEALEVLTAELLGVDEGLPDDLSSLPTWLRATDETAETARVNAAKIANVARYVFVGVLLFYLSVFALGDIACRNRIKRMIESAQANDPELEAQL